MYKISVIVPTYCPGDYIKDNVIGFSRQSLDHSLFEVLYILNDIREPYESILKNLLVQTDLHYRIIFTSEKGASHARNVGLDQALGEYVAFIDDDDHVSDHYLESLLNVSSEKEVGVSSFSAYDEETGAEDTSFFLCRKMRSPGAYLSLPFYRCRSILSVSVCKLTHRDIIGERRFDERFDLGEDSLFFTSLTDRFLKLNYAGDDAVYNCRLRRESATHRGYSTGFVIKNAVRLMMAYAHVYFSNPRGYSLRLFLFRFLGIIKNSHMLLTTHKTFGRKE